MFVSNTGAILFEGFDVNEGIEFQEVIQSYNPDLSDEYRGTSPRKLIPGTKVKPIYSWYSGLQVAMIHGEENNYGQWRSQVISIHMIIESL